MHVVDTEKYPLVSVAQYTPASHFIEEYDDAVIAPLQIPHCVFVQPSPYANDNSCLLDALRKAGANNARGIVQFDPHTIESGKLDSWHALGVRGVRVNLMSVGKEMSKEEFTDTILAYQPHLERLGWSLQLFISMPYVSILEEIVAEHKLAFSIIIDHFGGPSLPALPSRILNPSKELPGFQSLINLLTAPSTSPTKTYVKLSAPYRLFPRPDKTVSPSHAEQSAQFDALTPITMDILRNAGMSRVLFASDWPHTRFHGVDVSGWTKTLLARCWEVGGEEMCERVFRGNAEDLYGVAR